MNKNSDFIFLNDELLRQDEARIPAVTLGLYYGAGCFETFLSNSGEIFRFDEHIGRLKKGLAYLGVSSASEIEISSIRNKITQLLKANKLQNSKSKIRLQVSLINGGGYDSGNGRERAMIITSNALKKSAPYKSLVFSKTNVVPSSARPSHLKLSNMLHYRQAFREARSRGADDAILLNHEGVLAETSIANLFWKKENVIYTAERSCDILPGIIRNSLIEMLKRSKQFTLEMGKFKPEILLEADSAWLTNSVTEIVPVQKIENTQMGIDHVFFQELNNLFRAYKQTVN